jgi:hypothetical protein
MAARPRTNGRGFEDSNAFVGIHAPEVRGRRQACKTASNHGKIKALRYGRGFRAKIDGPGCFTPSLNGRLV